jgi:hypothetical protein
MNERTNKRKKERLEWSMARKEQRQIKKEKGNLSNQTNKPNISRNTVEWKKKGWWTDNDRW